MKQLTYRLHASNKHLKLYLTTYDWRKRQSSLKAHWKNTPLNHCLVGSAADKDADAGRVHTRWWTKTFACQLKRQSRNFPCIWRDVTTAAVISTAAHLISVSCLVLSCCHCRRRRRCRCCWCLCRWRRLLFVVVAVVVGVGIVAGVVVVVVVVDLLVVTCW